jgi:hypothetical protein
MGEIKKYKLKYTELIDEETERDGELVLETRDIDHSMERLMTKMHVVKMDCKQIKVK